MTQASILAVNVFGEENKKDEPVQQQNAQTPADQPEAKTPSTTEQGTNTTTTQVVTAQDDGSNLLANSTPWIAAGVVAIVILVALFAVLRKLNNRK